MSLEFGAKGSPRPWYALNLTILDWNLYPSGPSWSNCFYTKLYPRRCCSRLLHRFLSNCSWRE